MSLSLVAVVWLCAAEPTKSVEIVATDADTGKPIAGAVIRLFNGPRPTPYLFTDAAGKATAPLPEKGEMTIDIHTPSHIQQRVELTTKKPKVAIKLRKGERTAGGVVVDEAGKPIQGATIRFSAYLGKKKPQGEGITELVCDIDAVTDAEGRWRLQVVDASPKNLHFAVKHPEFVFSWQQPRQSANDLLNGTAKSELKRGVEVNGKILDEQGRPIAGAAVVAGFANDPVIDFSPRVVTKEDGAFRFVLAPGANTLTVQASGRSPAFKTLQVKAPTEVTFNLKPGRVVRGKVVDPAGKPVAGAGVVAMLQGINPYTPALRLSTIARKDGMFELADAPAELFNVRGSKDGYLLDIGGVAVPPNKNDVTIVVKPGPKLRGTVVDAATGKSMPEFTAALNFTPDSGTPAQFGFNRHFIETKGKDGCFELTHSQTINSLAQIGVWAPGYKLARSDHFPNDGKDRNFTLKLEKETRDKIAGVVRLPDGKPARGALVVRATGSTPQRFENGAIVNEYQTSTWRRCDSQGKFSFPPIDEESVLGVSHDAGQATWKPDAADAPVEITLKPWATIKGKFHLDGKPAPNQIIRYELSRDAVVGDRSPHVRFDFETTTDASGAFVLDRVPAEPGRLERLRRFEDGRGGGPFLTVASLNPKPGETVQLPTARQQGRTIIGKLKLPPSLKASSDREAFVLESMESQAVSDRPWIPFPPDIEKGDRKAQTAWIMEWRKTPEARKHFENYRRLSASVKPDGRLRVEGAKPDGYVLTVRLREPTASGHGPVLATATKKFVVPPMPNGYDDTPLDIGEIDVVESKVVRIGQKMPDITAKNLDDGTEWKLSSGAGKVRLIDFWATWCGPCIKAFPTLAALHKEHGGKGLEIISLSTDEDAKTAADFIKKEKCEWRQTHIGAKSPLSELLAIDAIPTFFVIGKDDTVIYRGHSPDAAVKAVHTELAK
jgi:thiol-disulfide isomerase/thioredoxin